MPMIGFSIAQIANMVQGEVEGNSAEIIYNFGKIETAKSGDITFLANQKYETFLYTTQASCVLIASDYKLKQPIKASLIRVPNPYAALTHLLSEYAKIQKSQLKGIHKKAIILTKHKIPKSVYIGPGAVIDQDVEIGEYVQIHALAYVGQNVKLGESVIVYPNASIYADCQIGARSIIHAGAVIGADGFGFSPNPDGTYTKIPQIGTVIIEEDVEIGANAAIDRATMGKTIIRKGVKIDNLVQIGHNVEIDEHTVIAGQSGIAGSTKIGKKVTIAGQVGISGHLTIGEGAILGPQTGVISKVDSGAKIMGSPSMPVKSFLKNMLSLNKLSDIIIRVENIEKKLNKINSQLDD